MEKNKRILAAVAAVGMSFSIFANVQAASTLTTDKKASALNTLNILQGDGKDFKLKDQLKRSEAAAFIVRLMGKEDYVLKNETYYKYTIFPDVKSSEWYATYVGYCSEQDIIGGYPDGKYGPDGYVSEKAFLKLVLSALGYMEGTDFTWDTVYQKAYEVGIVEDKGYQAKTEDNVKYTRENVVKVLYNALMEENKSTSVKLIQSLIDSKITDRETAVSIGVLKDDVKTQIEEIKLEEETKVTIKLNEPIEEIDKDDVHIFNTQTGEEVSLEIESQKEDEIILKTAKQIPYVEYYLEISDAKDLDGNMTDSLSGTFEGQRAAEVKSDFFKISKAEAMGVNTINVYFTHPININAEIPSYYEIMEGDDTVVKGSAQNMVVKLLGSIDNGVTLYLKDEALKKGENYVLKISGGLNSIYGVKLNEGQDESVRFEGVEAENEEFKVKDILMVSSKMLQLDFNKEVNPVLAQQIFNYYITDSDADPIKVEKAAVTSDGSNNGKSVRLTLAEALNDDEEYEVMINNLNDVTRQYSITEQSYSFEGEVPDKEDLVIEDISAIDAGTIEVYFDRPLDPDSAAIASNYSIVGVTHSGYSATPDEVYFDAKESPYKVRLFMPASKPLGKSKTYKLKVKSTLEDYLGNKSSKTIEEGFNSSSSTQTDVEVEEAVIISGDTIKVKFTKEIALEAPNILMTNYKLEYQEENTTFTKVPISVGYINGTTIVLKFDTLDFKTEYELKCGSLKDYAGNTTESEDEDSTKVVVGE